MAQAAVGQSRTFAMQAAVSFLFYLLPSGVEHGFIGLLQARMSSSITDKKCRLLGAEGADMHTPRSAGQFRCTLLHECIRRLGSQPSAFHGADAVPRGEHSRPGGEQPRSGQRPADAVCRQPPAAVFQAHRLGCFLRRFPPGQNNSVKLAFQSVQIPLVGDTNFAAAVNPVTCQGGDFRLQYRGRELSGGYSIAHAAAGLVAVVKERAAVTPCTQVIGGGKTGGPGADNSGMTAGEWGKGGLESMGQCFVAHKALE